jgi:hypothetical protein
MGYNGNAGIVDEVIYLDASLGVLCMLCRIRYERFCS